MWKERKKKTIGPGSYFYAHEIQFVLVNVVFIRRKDGLRVTSVDTVAKSFLRFQLVKAAKSALNVVYHPRVKLAQSVCSREGLQGQNVIGQWSCSRTKMGGRVRGSDAAHWFCSSTKQLDRGRRRQIVCPDSTCQEATLHGLPRFVKQVPRENKRDRPFSGVHRHFTRLALN